MYTKYLIPCVLFMLKYFFDIEKEITLQMLTNVNLKFHYLRELVMNYSHLLK
jgi:hypothetical protein